MNQDTINIAYDALADALGKLFEAHEAAVAAECSYADEADILLVTIPPKELGSNEDQRDAAIRSRLAPLHKTMREAQARERAAKWHHEQTRIEVSRYNTLLRLLSLQPGAPAEAPDWTAGLDEQEIEFA